MARLRFPDESSRRVEKIRRDNSFAMAADLPAVFYASADESDVTLADILHTDGTPIPGSVLTVDKGSGLPDFDGPDGDVKVVYVSVNGGPRRPVYASTGPLVEGLDARVGAVEGVAEAAVTGDVRAADGSVGYSTLWKHARVSAAPFDRVPIIAPTLPTEGVFCQEPQVWLYNNTIHMLYTAGSPASMHYATCPADADPIVPANWTKAGRVMGSGVGGASGTVQHPGIYVEGSTLYVYYVDNVGSVLSVATAPLANPTNFTQVGTVLNLPAGAGAPLANPFVLKVGSTYRLYFEANTVLPLWQIGMATGSTPDGLFTNPTFPLSGLSIDPGFSSNSNPFIIPEDGGYTMWFHGARGRSQRGSGSPTAGFLATSADGITWTVEHGGQPTVRLVHPLEVTQVADFSLLDLGAEKYAFWSANSTNNNTTNTGQIMATRCVRPVVVRRGGKSLVISGASEPTGPLAPWPWMSSSLLAADFTTTTVGSDVKVGALSNQAYMPDTVRGIAHVTLNLKTSAVGTLTVKCVFSGAVLLGGKSTVSAVMDAVPANQTVTISLAAIFECPAGKTLNQDWYVNNSAAAATTTVLAGSSSFVDTRKIP